MWRLALGVDSLCDQSVLTVAPTDFACFDMASALYGDFVADGEVNLFDLSLHIRLLFGGMDMASRYLTVQSTTAWAYSTQADCPSQRRRQALATIGKAWSVTCPSELSSCYYDCNEAPECKVSLEPTRVRQHTQGSWMHVPLPTPWSAASLLFSAT
eukprot:7384672-Prymnesium_polylepis.1